MKSKPKAVKPPPIPPPQAIPEVAPETEETEAKKVRRAMGYQRQILAGGLAPKSRGLG
jgi:hypothetical protein